MSYLQTLLEYQKFQPNAYLSKKIDAVSSRYLMQGVELEDEELDVAAAGEVYLKPRLGEKTDAD